MTAHALAGLALLNLLFLIGGAALLWFLRGWESWLEFARLAGLAYLAGVSSVGSLWVLLLIVGVPFSFWLVVAVPTAVGLIGLVGGRTRGRRRPALGSHGDGKGLVVTALGIAAAGLLLEGFFRSARLTGVQAWDAWSFWIPKAKAIYFFGGLDEQFFTTLPGSSYPPLVPVIDAAAFQLMGSVDVVTLHLQFWLFGVGFIWALSGLLAERVPGWMLWPFVLLLLVAPRVGDRLSIPEADLLLDYFFVIACVLVAFWILDGARWQLVLATILLCGMVLTKREGLLLGALLLAAALLASARQWRSTWPSLGASAAVVVAVAAPWRIWYVVHDVAGEGPSEGFVPRDNLEWLWPAVRRALDVLGDTGYWNLIVPLAVGALILAALARGGVLVVYFGTLLFLVTLGGIWATWAFSKPWITGELGGNFIIRFMGAAALLCVAATPLLLSAAWRSASADKEREAVRSAAALPAAIVVVPLLVYPILTLTGGWPRFPTRDECVHVATRDADDLEVVYGRLDDPVAAEKLFGELTRVGFVGNDLEPDTCGHWKVSYDAIATLAEGMALVEGAHRAGFDARVEHEG